MHAQTSHFNGEVFSKVSEVKTDVIAYFDFSRVLLPSRLHSFFVIRILFFRRRLDILFFLPIQAKIFADHSEDISSSNAFGVWMVLMSFWSSLTALKPDVTHITSCKNVISIEHTASAVVFASFAVQRKEEFCAVQLKLFRKQS